MNKKLFISIISITTIFFAGINTITYTKANASTLKSTTKNKISGKWKNQTGDQLNIKNNKVTLTTNKNNKYKFVIKEKTKDKYELKNIGKKLDNSKRYSIKQTKQTIIFTYDNNTMTFNKKLYSTNINQPNDSIKQNTNKPNINQTNNTNTQSTSNNDQQKNNQVTDGIIYGDPNQLDDNGQTAYQANPENAGKSNTYTFMTSGGFWETRQRGY